jgi:hypothetical protein
MLSSEMSRRVVLVRTEVSEELIASIFRVEIVPELGTTLAVTVGTSVLTRPARRHIPEDGILNLS